MENIYKYKDIEFKPVKKTLKFHKENYHFIKKFTSEITNSETNQLDNEKFWDYIHTEDNIREIILRFLDGDTEKIIIDVETDEDYNELITLVSKILTDFFSTYKPLTMK